MVKSVQHTETGQVEVEVQWVKGCTLPLLMDLAHIPALLESLISRVHPGLTQQLAPLPEGH